MRLPSLSLPYHPSPYSSYSSSFSSRSAFLTSTSSAGASSHSVIPHELSSPIKSGLRASFISGTSHRLPVKGR
ncbi:hypothetical protein E2C01_043355 [Portunus trituberculatus]|uniref:Uncharacterized protein n=1 Tax=Portunus trituberculatus TaxID=210409 RepID=A0A5B7FXB9_PORTR|nr:hypothetical protein [Portunus trituberculatus]